MSVKRIQRKRTKGWKMPPNTVYVGRPSKYGNPYPVGRRNRNSTLALVVWDMNLKMFKEMTKGGLFCPDVQTSLLWYGRFLNWFMSTIHGRATIMKLKGKNLACWCPLDEPCHADVLLEIANKVVEEKS